MDALVAAGCASRSARGMAPGDALRVVIVPTAAARQRPELAAAHGRTAFEAAARRAGIGVVVDVARVVDRQSAADPANAALLDAADVVHLPGGHPDLVPAVMRATAAWAAILRAHARGGCIAGASAGAMALGERLWTPAGAAEGLRLVPGLAVVPHFDTRRAAVWRVAVDPAARLAWLGLDERTLVVGRPGEAWTVAGAGRVHLLPPGASTPSETGEAGTTVVIPGTPVR